MEKEIVKTGYGLGVDSTTVRRNSVLRIDSVPRLKPIFLFCGCLALA